jgi:hypothetical protein
MLTMLQEAAGICMQVRIRGAQEKIRSPFLVKPGWSSVTIFFEISPNENPARKPIPVLEMPFDLEGGLQQRE